MKDPILNFYRLPYLSLLLLLVFSPLSAHRATYPPATQQTASPCFIQNEAWQDGEEIVYKLYYNWNFVWLSAGEVTFDVHDTGKDYHIAVRGRTYSSYEWFFKVRDNYESWIDKETLLPKMHVKDVQEGGYLRYDRTTFNQNGRSAVSMRGKTRDDLKRKDIPLDGCMHDLISIIYYARNLDFNGMRKGNKIPVKILMDQEIYPLTIKYNGADSDKKIKGVGRFATQMFSPQLVAGDVFKEGDEMTVWVSDDKNRIPILIESPVSVGSVKAVLKSHKNLRHPLTSKKD
ncbi:MAG: DUF3108 domain-containing protein [Saprospiraceae bacterium]